MCTDGNGSAGSFGGTSCAAPLWAGFTALVNQQLVTATGVATNSVGFINPAIYALGNTASYASCFHDTTTGDNSWSASSGLFVAATGYDLCTGWGTPNGTNLVNALADMLRVTPSSGFAADGPTGGPFCPSSQSFTLTNAGIPSLTWSTINTSAWLSVSASSGALAGAAQTNVTISLNSAANSLAAGTNVANVGFSNQSSGLVQSRQFTVLAGQALVQNGGFETGGFAPGRSLEIRLAPP